MFQRFVLLSIVCLSLIIPFTNHKISPPLIYDNPPALQDQPNVKYIEINNELNISTEEQIPATFNLQLFKSRFSQFFEWIYFSVISLLFLKIIIGVSWIFRMYKISEKKKAGKYIQVTHKKQTVFSFFNYIFIPEKIKDYKNLPKILIHEKTHADQLHSIDVVLTEILTCVFWFNPMVWHFKNHLKLIHEYLADEQVLKNGFDVIEYQKDLINQIEEFQQLVLGSNYFFSTKKRIMMMTKIKNRKIGFYHYFGLLLIIIITFLFAGIVNAKNKNINQEKNSIFYDVTTPQQENSIGNIDDSSEILKNDKNNFSSDQPYVIDFQQHTQNDSIEKPRITAIELPKMNVLYTGVENPLKIAVAGMDCADLDVTIDNGIIDGENGNYIISHAKPGKAMVKVKYRGEVIQETEFRVKRIPNPLTTSNEDHKVFSGKITKEEILKWGTVEFLYKYLDIDYNVQVIFFNIIIVPINDGERTDPVPSFSYNKYYTETQLGLINKLKSGDLVYFEDIIVLGFGDIHPIQAGAASLVIE